MSAVEWVGGLRQALVATYGRWESASGTAHGAEDWYCILADALAAEARSLPEAVEVGAFAFIQRVVRFTPEAQEALLGVGASASLSRCLGTLTSQDLATPASAAGFFQGLCHCLRATLGLRGIEVMQPIRASLTGGLRGPCLGIVASLLGTERCMRRLRDTLS